MARDFDEAVPDSINWGSDASINDFALKSMLMWVEPDDGAGAVTTESLLHKRNNLVLTHAGWALFRATSIASSGHLQFFQEYATTDGEWVTADGTVPNAALTHVAVTHDAGDQANDPSMYINGTLQAETETSPPLGAAAADAALDLRTGVDGAGGGNPYDGRAGFIVYDSTLFTAADINRHRWWGVAPGGPSTVDVWHPLWTESLTNKGTATANGTASGTTGAALPRVERCWGASMGCGR